MLVLERRTIALHGDHATLFKQMIDKTPATLLDQIERQLKIFRLALIWIGDFAIFSIAGIVEKKGNFFGQMIGTKRLQMLHVFCIHGNDVIEAIKITGNNLPRTQGGEIEAAPCGVRNTARVRRAPGVKAVRAGRVDFEMVRQAILPGQLAKYRFRCWRAANISHANKQYFHGELIDD